MENLRKIELLMDLISTLSHNLGKDFYQFRFKRDNSITFKSFESLDSSSLFLEIKDILSDWNTLSLSLGLKFNFHLNPKDREITLSW